MLPQSSQPTVVNSPVFPLAGILATDTATAPVIARPGPAWRARFQPALRKPSIPPRLGGVQVYGLTLVASAAATGAMRTGTGKQAAAVASSAGALAFAGAKPMAAASASSG